jgi:predicted ATPase
MRVLTHLSLENFRLFKEKTSFVLAPITILTGTNSSGKSSLIKSILLLKANFEKNKSIEEIDFSIGDHNLNNFKNTLNYDSGTDFMAFSFSSFINNLGNYNIELRYKLDFKNKAEGNLYSFVIHSSEGKEILSASKGYDDDWTGPYIKYKIDILHFIKNLRYGSFLNFDNELKLNAEQLLYNIDLDSKEYRLYLEVLEGLRVRGIDRETGITYQEEKIYNQSLEKGVSNLGKEAFYSIERKFEEEDVNVDRSKFGDFFYNELSSVLKGCIENVIFNFTSISSFDSIRSESMRFYLKNKDKIALFLAEYKNQSDHFNQEVKEFVKEQLALFSLGEEIIIESDEEEIIYKVFLKQGNRNVLLSDLGFGYTQLLPVIMKIALAGHLNLADVDEIMAGAYEGEQPYYHNHFLLQEPEANLHPSFQSKIADLIVEANKKFNVRFVIETHSEYLIRNLQYLVAKKNLIPDGIKIFYFHKAGSADFKNYPYKEINIQEDGRLSSEFGEGFLDEIPRLLAFLYNSSSN